MTLTPGTVVSQYEVRALIGAGGMGEVYRARDRRLGRDVALKFLAADLAADSAGRDRLLREARIASALNHPNICTIYEVGEAGGRAFLAMEFLAGQTLAEAIPPEGLPAETVARYGIQIADALAHAHTRGVIHRDLKSRNVMLSAEGRAKVLDFGLAELQPVEALDAVTRSWDCFTEADPLAGTLAYMAPERLRGARADEGGDIWALGVLLYEMAAGTRPFIGQTGFELSSDILTKSPEPLPASAPASLAAVIFHCLAKDPAERYRSSSEVRAALEVIGASGRSSTAAASISLPVPAGQAEKPPAARLVPRRAMLRAAAAVVAVVLALWGWHALHLGERISGGAARIQSIAVLPLANLSADPAQEYFADGMTDALITDLSQIQALRVISRASVMRFKETNLPLKQIARQLHVDAVVEGSVLRAGDRVRVTVQLTRAADDRNLWAQSYERHLYNVIALQSEVARAIAEEVRAELTPQEHARLSRERPVKPAALEAYLKGRYYWNKRTPEGLKHSVEYFNEAIRLDPNYALAYAGLADAYSLGADSSMPAGRANEMAKEAARRALSLDDSLAQAHAALASALWNEWNWAGAETEFRRALALNPNYATAHHWYSVYLSALGRNDEAIAEARRALEIDPLSLIIQANLGGRLLYARRYDEAITECRKALEMDSSFPIAHECLGLAYVQQKKYGEAIAEFGRAAEFSPGDLTPTAERGFASAAAGDRREAEEVLVRLQNPAAEGTLPAYEIAIVYAGLGEKQKALDWLERAYRKRSVSLLWLRLDPMLDSLRSEPRFQELMRQVGFPPESKSGAATKQNSIDFAPGLG